MKKQILTLTIAAFVALSVNAQVSTSNKKEERKTTTEKSVQTDRQQTQQTKQDNPNAPVIKFDKTVHDYGEIMQNADGNCKFKFTNEGKEPLILSNVRSSCGCTIPEWPRQPILPGQSDAIKVKYDTKRVDVINKTITVYSNAKESPITLKIKGKVLASDESKMPEKKEAAGSPVNK